MITVEPQSFTKVEYDAEMIASLAQVALERVGLLPADIDVTVEVVESDPTTQVAVISIEPAVFRVASGAIENLKDPRTLGEREATVVFTRLFLELFDRRNPWFQAPPVDAEVPMAHLMAWDVNLYGRVALLGVPLHEPKYRYNFRNRHGFTDHADRVFDQLWSAGETTWARIVGLSDSARQLPAG